MDWCGDEVCARKGLGDVRSRTSAFMSWNSAAWRLARPYWGEGFATAAAQSALEFGFETVDLPEIVALTMPGNARSRAVRERAKAGAHMPGQVAPESKPHSPGGCHANDYRSPFD